jgi:pyruvate formate lyase activating enzyme
MRIGGLQHSSLVDFPGKVAAVVFTVGCNFRCPYCHNPELVIEAPERLIPEQEVFDFLQARASVLQGVVVTGGEPTMHEDLPEFFAAIKKLGYLIKLDTNGTNPAMLRAVVERGLVDYVAMDIKAPLSRYAAVVGAAVDMAAIRESVNFLRTDAVPYEFRTTVVRSQLSPADILEIGSEIRGAAAYYLQQFTPVKTLSPAFRSKISYEKEELAEFARALREYVDHCDVRA